MKYQRVMRVVLCLACMGLIGCLAGCSVSFCGFRPGGRGELVFSCTEGILTEGTGTVSSEGAETVPEKGDAAGGGFLGETESESVSGDEPAQPASPGVTSDGRVNINTASQEELMTLNSIGETRARAIVEYRAQNGPFTKAEDIMQIPGIKEGIYSKIQDQIVVW